MATNTDRKMLTSQNKDRKRARASRRKKTKLTDNTVLPKGLNPPLSQFPDLTINFTRRTRNEEKEKVKLKQMAMQSTQSRLCETEDKQPNFFKKQNCKEIT